MNKFTKLSKAEMKNVIGGTENKDCQGTVTCADGTHYAGIFDCGDFVYGGDGELICTAYGHGSSVSCDCGSGGGGGAA